MSVCCECCVLSGRGICDELIIRPEESYRLWCVVVCDLETTKILVNEEEAKAHEGGYRVKREKKGIKITGGGGGAEIRKIIFYLTMLWILHNLHDLY